MKKLLTIVLALVMVFAIAAPAFAMGADALVAPAAGATASEYFDISVDFYKGKLAPAASAASLNLAPATDMFAKDQQISVAIKVANKIAATVAPKPADVTAAMAKITDWTLDVSITGLKNPDTELVQSKITFDNDPSVPAYAATGSTAFAWVADDKAYEATIASTDANALLAVTDRNVGDAVIYVITGHVAADVVVKAATNPVETAAYVTSTDTNGYVKINNGIAADSWGIDYTNATTGVSFTLVWKVTDANKTDTFTFTPASPDATKGLVGGELIKGTKVKDLEATGALAPYYIADVWTSDNTNALPKAYRDAIDYAMSFMGFDYSKKDDTQVKQAYFDAKISTVRLAKDATAKLFTAALTVSDTTTVPNTGDNAAVIGFVMIALAIVAAAAVAVKKVRA